MALPRLAALWPLLLLLGACTTLPDAKPFAAATARLSAAAGAHYNELGDDLASLEEPRLARNDASFEARRAQLQQTQATFAATGRELDRLFAAMTEYSQTLASLAEQGKQGPEAAQSLLDSARGFADLGGLANIPREGAEPLIAAFKAIGDEVTRIQAKHSLSEAVAAADPAVQQVARQFALIYGQALPLANEGVYQYRKREASLAAGSAVIGFDAAVRRRYDGYYRQLLGWVAPAEPEALDDDSLPPPDWRGFCENAQGPCRAKRELEAVGLVEARMAAIAPLVHDYRARLDKLDEQRRQRRAAGKAVVKAVNAWAREHQALQRALAEGRRIDAATLKAALAELDRILGKP